MTIARWVSRTAVAALTGTVLVASSVGGAIAATVEPLDAGTAALAGASPPLVAAPTSVGFPGRALSTTSSVRTVTFSNSTGDPQTVVTVQLAGGEAADFAISAETCTTGPIASSGTCTVDLTFTPAALGLRAAELQLVDGAAGVLGDVALDGVGQTVSNLGWANQRLAGPSRTWSYGSELARSVTTTSARYLQAVYTTDRIGGTYVTDHGPYLGVYYIRSRSSTGATWSTPVRLNASTKHGDDATIATSGAYVYAAWVSQTKYVGFNAAAPRALYIRVNSHYGKGSWRSAIRLTASTGRVYDAHVAASGKRVYVSYTDSNTGRIRLKISSNHGRTWRSVALGTTSLSGSIGKQGGATVGANGSTVVVAWAADADHMIKARRSTNGGKTWGSTVTLGASSTGLPKVAVLGSRAVVAWPTVDGVDARIRTSSGWGATRSVTPPDDGKGYITNYAAAVALNATSRVGIAWTACWSDCDGAGAMADIVWSESATNGAAWYVSQVVGPASASASSHVNDGAAIVWPSTNRRTIMWNGWTPDTASTRLSMRTSFGSP